MFGRSYLEIQHWLQLWYLHLLNLCPRHNTRLSLSVFWTHSVNKMSALFLFFNSPRPPWESGVTSLIFMLAQPSKDVHSSFTDYSGEHLYPLGLIEQLPALLQCPIFVRVLFPGPHVISDCDSIGGSTAVAWLAD